MSTLWKRFYTQGVFKAAALEPDRSPIVLQAEQPRRADGGAVQSALSPSTATLQCTLHRGGLLGELSLGGVL